MARPPKKIKTGAGRPAINKNIGQSLHPGVGRGSSGSGGLFKPAGPAIRPGFGGLRPAGPPPSARPGNRRGGVYRSHTGSLLGSLLAGALLSGNGLDDLAQGIGQALAGTELGGDVGEVSPEQEINTLAPAYPVECPHCGATIPAFVWVCEYCDSPRPATDDDKTK